MQKNIFILVWLGKTDSKQRQKQIDYVERKIQVSDLIDFDSKSGQDYIWPLGNYEFPVAFFAHLKAGKPYGCLNI